MGTVLPPEFGEGGAYRTFARRDAFPSFQADGRRDAMPIRAA